MKKGMESAHWRNYRGHLIVVRKTVFGLLRYEVWKPGRLVGTFRDGVVAELHVDALVREDASEPR